MKIKLDTTRYFLPVFTVSGIIYKQDGIDFDQNGLSIKEFPNIHIQESTSQEDIIISHMGQPYKTIKTAKRALINRNLSEDEYEIVPYKKGYGICKKTN